MSIENKHKNIYTKLLNGEYSIILLLAFCKLLIHFTTNGSYGYHRDELLYAAMGEHLALGYVDNPPSIAYFAFLARGLLGDSLFALRLFPALLGAVNVLLIGLMVRTIGGRRFAQVLACTVFLFSPAFLASNHLFQPVSFNQFYWTLCCYLVIRITRYRRPSWWVYVGLVVGFALLNKYTILLFVFGLFVGILFTPQRMILLSNHPYKAAGLGLLIFLPNLFWQIINGFPELTHLKQLSEHQLAHTSTLDFLLEQALFHGAGVFVWIMGLFYIFVFDKTKPFRLLGWTYLTVLIVLILLQGKGYYMLGVYPMLFAFGACALEKWMNIGSQEGRFLTGMVKMLLLIFVIVGNFLVIPYGLPILSVQQFDKYANYMGKQYGLTSPLRWETGKVERITQDYADMFGWKQMTEMVAQAYHQLTPEEQVSTLIFAENYGQAGAIDFFGANQKLPYQKYGRATSFSSSYDTWFPEKQATESEIVIYLGHITELELQIHFESVERINTLRHKYARESGVSVYLCRRPLGEWWR